MPSLQKHSWTKLCDGAQMAIFASFLRPAFPPSRMQHISDMHSKFALRPHHVHIQSPTADNKRRKKKKERRKKLQLQNIMSASATQSGHDNLNLG